MPIAQSLLLQGKRNHCNIWVSSESYNWHVGSANPLGNLALSAVIKKSAGYICFKNCLITSGKSLSSFVYILKTELFSFQIHSAAPESGFWTSLFIPDTS